MLSNRKEITCGALALGLGVLSTARADLIADLPAGLNAIGVDVRGRHNIASGGIDLLVSRDFLGNPIDFGAADLAIEGPVSFDLSTGGRIIPGIELTFSTAIDGDSTPTPLSYVFHSDAGSQQTDVSGSLLIDAGLNVNKFGYYRVNLSYSSRQHVTRAGRFATDDATNDFDIGPVSLSGNLYADGLAFLTQPLFSATDTMNIFSTFSGADSLSQRLLSSADAARLQLASGSATDTRDAAARATRLHVFEDRFSDVRAETNTTSAGLSNISVVPEPTVLLLMLLGLPAILRRRRTS